jgi:hypothetical protein
MPPALRTQNTIAFIWDFDKTLTPGYMQEPLFKRYGVDSKAFWDEVNALVDFYSKRGLQVSKDTAYLGHMLKYIDGGPFSGLTNETLRELGGEVPLAPGMPDFMGRMKDLVRNNDKFAHHEINVEHYIVSTGLRQMIEGNPIRAHVDGVWACELLSDPPGAGYLAEPPPEGDGKLTQVGYALDNTTKTRAVFEINKGVNIEPGLDVNARMDPDDRRVPITNMIYVADGPSDVPVFSVVGGNGGKTFGVWTDRKNYEGVKGLQDDGRIQGMARADYSEGSDADMWLTSTLQNIANRICDARDRRFANITGPAGHAV